MKKLLLMICLMFVGCTSVRKLEDLENALYETKDVYVEMEKAAVFEYFSINEKDFSDFIALKTLLVFNEKEIYIFENASEHLLQVLKEKEKGFISVFDKYTVYLSEKDEELLNLITKYLNE